MAIVIGKIEPLKRIRKVLDGNGISRLNSIGEIKSFVSGFSLERKEVRSVVKKSMDDTIALLDKEIRSVLDLYNSSFRLKIIYFFKFKYLTIKISFFKKNYERIIKNKCNKIEKSLDHTKSVVDGMADLIAGAIGESKVVAELQKLENSYYLINDFSMKFDPPLFYREQKTRIFSIQIDQLLIGRSGVFLIETKNWSRISVERLDLRSPVEQIRRTSYALFVLLNGDSKIKLNSHHWGNKKIPIRNLLAMTNEKPIEEFQHVKTLSLSELNGYIAYFPNIFSDSEVEEIFNYLCKCGGVRA